MTKKELTELRASKVSQMETIVNERSADMNDEVVSTIKTLKDEINNIDANLEGIEAVRSVAVANSAPASKKIEDAQTEFKNTFTEYIRGKIDNATLEKRIMQSGTAGKGLETVPDEFYKTLLDKILEYGMLFSDANVMTTANHGDLLIPMADDTGASGAWTSEGGAISPTDFATSQVTMKAYKVATAIVVSTELLEDAFFDVTNYVAAALGVRLARTFEAAFISGDGIGKPTGIVADTNTVANVTAGSGTTVYADIHEMIYSLSPSLRVGGIVYASDGMIKEMTGWVDTTGRQLLQTNSDSTQANGIIMSIDGYPVRLNNELGDASTAADVPAIFGNPQNYWIRNIRNITVKRSDELYALTDEILFTAATRLDGKPVNANPAFAKLTVKA